MTALSMIFGVLPAAIGVGPGAETRAPMAVAVAAGMLSSTILTLFIVPVVYVLLDALARKVRGNRKSGEDIGELLIRLDHARDRRRYSDGRYAEAEAAAVLIIIQTTLDAGP